MGSLITREKRYTRAHTITHTHRKNTQKRARALRLTFCLSSIVPSAWLTLTSEAAGLIISWGE